VLTDHKPLNFALHRVSDAWSARQQRQLSYIAEYTSDVRHVAGVDNVVADALSRPAAVIAAPAATPIDFSVLAHDQKGCADTQRLAREGSLQVKQVEVAGVQLLCDVSAAVLRPLVPVQQRRAMFEALHSLSHPGIRATCRIVTARFVWRGFATEIGSWCKECVGCARGKTHVHCKSKVEKIPVPGQRFQHVHVDLAGPLPVSGQGHSYILTMIDRTSRWPEAVPLSSITAEACADAFVSGWIARFGVPAVVTTDRGTQFSSATWACLARTLGFQHVMTSAYHPQSNGMVEQLHRQLKGALRARVCGASWLEHLPWVMMGIRAAPKEEANISPAQMVYGTDLVLLGQPAARAAGATDTAAGEEVKSIPLRQRSYAEVARGPVNKLVVAQYVYVRRGAAANPMAPPYDGPFLVLQRGEKTFQLQIGQRRETISMDRLKPHEGEGPVAVGQPPKKGRPPRTGGGKVDSCGAESAGGPCSGAENP
jgi:Integrase core domain/Integrase zinc binding domain